MLRRAQHEGLRHHLILSLSKDEAGRNGKNLSNTSRNFFQPARGKLRARCWITLRRRFFFEISFVKSEAALEPSRSNSQLRYIPTIASEGNTMPHLAGQGPHARENWRHWLNKEVEELPEGWKDDMIRRHRPRIRRRQSRLRSGHLDRVVVRRSRAEENFPLRGPASIMLRAQVHAHKGTTLLSRAFASHAE